MNPDPDPCSTCGRRRRFGKKSWNPGGRRWLSSARSTCWDRMNTTDGFTCSATATNASWKSPADLRSEEHTSELQSRLHLVCRLLLEKKNAMQQTRALHRCRAAHQLRHHDAAGPAARYRARQRPHSDRDRRIFQPRLARALAVTRNLG